MTKRVFQLPLLCGLMLLFAAQALRSATITFTATGPASEGPGIISAAACLWDHDGLLHVTLTNTTPGGTERPGDVLTAFFFTIGGSDPALALHAANAPAVIRNGAPAGSGVSLLIDGGYQLAALGGGRSGKGAWTVAYEYGVSTAGFGLFHGSTVGDVNYGIVAEGTDTTQASLRKRPFVQQSAIFILSGFGGLSAGQVTSGAFAFGTGPEVLLDAEPPGERLPPAVPEPSSWALAGIGVALLGAADRKSVV